MRLFREAWRQLLPLFRRGTEVEFDYHGRHRDGAIDTVGEGPNGAFFTLRQPEGEFKSFSLAKVRNLRVLEANSHP